MSDHTTDPLKAERQRLVRRLLVEGTTQGAIVRALVGGVQLPDGRTAQVSESTARRDVREVAREFDGLFTDADAVVIEVSAAYDRIGKIGKAAMAAGRYGDALRAELALVKLATCRRPEWATLHGRRLEDIPGEPGGAGDEGLTGDQVADRQWAEQRLGELARMTPAELRAHHDRLARRVGHLRLVGDEAPAASKG